MRSSRSETTTSAASSGTTLTDTHGAALHHLEMAEDPTTILRELDNRRVADQARVDRRERRAWIAVLIGAVVLVFVAYNLGRTYEGSAASAEIDALQQTVADQADQIAVLTTTIDEQADEIAALKETIGHLTTEANALRDQIRQSGEEPVVVVTSPNGASAPSTTTPPPTTSTTTTTTRPCTASVRGVACIGGDR